jgi:HSP20 family protein
MFPWRLGINPIWAELDRLQRSLDDLFDAVTRSRKPLMDRLWGRAQLFQLLNVRELDQSFVVTTEIPGMKIDDLEIRIIGGTLTLRGERIPQEVGEGVSYHRRERATGIFQRSLTLPGKVDAENIGATYKDGVLTVTLPKEKTAPAPNEKVAQI